MDGLVTNIEKIGSFCDQLRVRRGKNPTSGLLSTAGRKCVPTWSVGKRRAGYRPVATGRHQREEKLHINYTS